MQGEDDSIFYQKVHKLVWLGLWGVNSKELLKRFPCDSAQVTEKWEYLWMLQCTQLSKDYLLEGHTHYLSQNPSEGPLAIWPSSRYCTAKLLGHSFQNRNNIFLRHSNHLICLQNYVTVKSDVLKPINLQV